MTSEVASRVNFGAILKHLLAPKMDFLLKKEVPGNQSKKSTPKAETRSGSPYGQTGWLPESPTSRTHFSNKKQLFEQLLQHCSGFIAKKSESVQKK